jgi:hypothetical protein
MRRVVQVVSMFQYFLKEGTDLVKNQDAKRTLSSSAVKGRCTESFGSLSMYFLKEVHHINFAQLVSKTRVQIFIDSTNSTDFKKFSINGLIKTYGFKSIKQFKIDIEKYAGEDYANFIAKMKNNG